MELSVLLENLLSFILSIIWITKWFMTLLFHVKHRFLVFASLKYFLFLSFIADLYSSVLCLSNVVYLFTIPDLQIFFSITDLRSGRRTSLLLAI